MLGTSPWTGPATVPITPILTGRPVDSLPLNFSDDEMQSAISMRPNVEFSLVPKCELWVLGINQIWSSAKCDRLCKRSSPTDRHLNQSQLIKWNRKVAAPIFFVWGAFASLKETIRSNTPKLGLSSPEARLRFKDECWKKITLLNWHGWVLRTSPWTAPADSSYNAHQLTGLSIHYPGIFFLITSKVRSLSDPT